MNKKTEKGLVIGLAIGVFTAAALSSKNVRNKIKRSIKGEEKSKLDAIREILEDKKEQGLEKAENIKDKLAEKKNDISK